MSPPPTFLSQGEGALLMTAGGDRYKWELHRNAKAEAAAGGAPTATTAVSPKATPTAA